jgi:inosine-uridine nucleoside N-ribohydrolase
MAQPELFQAEPAGVCVETRGSCTLGKSVNDLYSDKQFAVKNVLFVTAVDEDGFADFLKKR